MAFEVEAAELAGLGKQTERIAEDISATREYVDRETVTSGIFSGTILGVLDAPFGLVRGQLEKEYTHMGEKTESMAVELNRAAWMYHDQEARNYDALNAHMADKSLDSSQYGSHSPAPGPAEPYPDPARYVLPENFELKAPDHGTTDIRDVIAESGGWLGDVDDFVKSFSGWSPLETLIAPLAGNWNEIKRIGSAYKVSGEAIETCGNNMEAGKKQIADWWEGSAANNFQNYATKQHEALQWWGPGLRVAEKLMSKLSEALLDGVKELLSWIKNWMEKQIQIEGGIIGKFKMIAKNFPAARGAMLSAAIYQAYQVLNGIIEKIREIVDSLKEFLPLITSPSGHYNEQFEQKLAPITKAVEGVKFALDVKSTADTGPVVEKPKEDFSVGTGLEPWAA